MAQDTKEALEQLTDSLNRSNSLLETIKGALSQQISASEGLKTAMIKSNTFSQGKMFKALNMVADLPGRFDKVLKSFGQFLQEGLGANNKEFLGALSKIEALGLNSAPFLQLTRAMNNRMGESVEQQTKSLTQLMNLRDLTKANPELLATALNKHQQTFIDAAGIYGPQFSQDMRAVVTTLASTLGGGGAMLDPLMSLISKFTGEGVEQKALRGMIGLPENLAELTSPEQIMSQFVVPLIKAFSENPLFTGPDAEMNRAMLGSVFGLTPADFALIMKTATEMPEVAELNKLTQESLKELKRSQDIEKKLSFVMDGISNAFFSILTPTMEYLSEVMGEEGLGGQVVELSKQIADWIGGELKSLTIKAIDIFNEFRANGGITMMQEKIAEAGKLVGEIWEGAKTTVTGMYRFLVRGGMEKVFENILKRFETWREQLGARFDHFVPYFQQVFIESISYMGQVLIYAMEAGALMIWKAVTQLFPEKQTAEKAAAAMGLIAGIGTLTAGALLAPVTGGMSLMGATALVAGSAGIGYGAYKVTSAAGGALANAKERARAMDPGADFRAKLDALEKPNFEMKPFVPGSRELELLDELKKSNDDIRELIENLHEAEERTAEATEAIAAATQE